MNYKFGQVTALGALLALIALIVVIILIVVGQIAWMPMGLILALLALSRLC